MCISFGKGGAIIREISFIIITYNEERCIERCIKSVKDIATEIIIVDTGSTDRTLDILNKINYNNVFIHYFSWCDDFSKARNFGLAKANSDWVFYIDSDEWLDSSISKERFLKEINKIEKSERKTTVFYPIIKNHNEQLTLGVNRLFWRNGEYAWHGRVHEEIRKRDEKTKCKKVNIILNHDGYKLEIFEHKNKKNRSIKLLEKAIEEDKKNLRWKFFLIRETIGVYEKERSIKLINILRKDMDSVNNQYSEEKYTLLIELIRLTIFDDDFEEALINELEETKYSESNTSYFVVLREIINFRRKMIENIGKLAELRYGVKNEEYSLSEKMKHLDFLLAISFYYVGDNKKSDLIMNTVKETYCDKYILENIGLRRML